MLLIRYLEGMRDQLKKGNYHLLRLLVSWRKWQETGRGRYRVKLHVSMLHSGLEGHHTAPKSDALNCWRLPIVCCQLQ